MNNFKMINATEVLNVTEHKEVETTIQPTSLLDEGTDLQKIIMIFERSNISCECIETIDSPNSTIYKFKIYNSTFNKVKSLEKTLRMETHENTVVGYTGNGESGISISVPKHNRDIVLAGDCWIDNKIETNSLQIPIGKDEFNQIVNIDLAKLPHLLICGSTGSGKSVCLHNIISSLILNHTPYSLEFIMIDPKQVELVQYNKLKTFMPLQTITNVYKASIVLRNLTRRMDEIYRLIQSKGCTNIDEFNEVSENKLPRTVVVIDELADLMIQNKKEVEPSLIRIAQLGRACGIHIIAATQRPSRDVITGLINVNIPARICFRVPTAVNSRVALDKNGAEDLLGDGDGYFKNSNGNGLIRFQSPLLSSDEIETIINKLNEQL